MKTSCPSFVVVALFFLACHTITSSASSCWFSVKGTVHSKELGKMNIDMTPLKKECPVGQDYCAKADCKTKEKESLIIKSCTINYKELCEVKEHSFEHPEYGYLTCKFNCCQGDMCNSADSIWSRITTFGTMMGGTVFAILVAHLLSARDDD